MTIATFGVDAGSVRRHHFPQWPDFSTASSPTLATVGEFITEAAADLAGRLELKSLSPATIAADTASEAYSWCAKTLRLAVAIDVLAASTSANPELAKKWQVLLDGRYELLEKYGATAMGVGAAATDDSDEPEGPTSHISELDLDTGNDSDASDVIPRLRRSDEL